MGGWPPLGYEVENRRLVVVEREAALVRRIFDRFAKTGSALTVARELNAAGEVTKRRQCANGARGGKPWTKGAVYKVLANRVYLGEAVHKGVAYPGEHAAIVDQRTWDKAHAVMAEPAHRRGAATRAQVPALLKGLIFGPNGRPMSPSHTRRRGRIYRYYVTREAIADGYDSCAVTSVPAADVEGAVLDHVQKLLAAPELVARTWAAAKRESEDEITEREVTDPARRLRHGLERAVPRRAGADRPAARRAGRRAGGRARGADQGRGAGEPGRRAAAAGREEGGMTQGVETPARRQHAGRADPDALPAPRRPQAHRRPGRQRACADARSRSRTAHWSRRWRGRGGGSECWMTASTPRSARSATPRTSRRATSAGSCGWRCWRPTSSEAILAGKDRSGADAGAAGAAAAGELGGAAASGLLGGAS